MNNINYSINGSFSDVSNMRRSVHLQSGKWYGDNIPNEWTTNLTKTRPLTRHAVYYSDNEAKYYANLHTLTKNGNNFVPFVCELPPVVEDFNLTLSFSLKPFDGNQNNDWAVLYDVLNTNISGRVTAENTGEIVAQANDIPANTPISLRFWKENPNDKVGLTDVVVTIDVPTTNE
jgi:hypothetical protein